MNPGEKHHQEAPAQRQGKSKGFTDEERAAMKERIQEEKAEREDKAGGESDVLAAIAAMQESDRCHGQADPCDHQSQRASPLAENLVRDACVCQQGRQGRLLLPAASEVQHEVRDVRLQRHGEPRRRHHVADRLRAEGVDCRRRGKDRRAREESGALRTALAYLEEKTCPRNILRFTAHVRTI